MNTDFLTYYQQELAQLRGQASTFADTYPKVAERLKLNHAEAEDPFIARLIESVAFLTARIHQRMDWDQTRLLNDIIKSIYPLYLMPIPAAAIIQLQSANSLDKPYTIARDTEVATQTHQQKLCRFNTCFETTLHPIQHVGTTLSSTIPVPQQYTDKTIKSALTLTLTPTKPDQSLHDVAPPDLTYYLNLPLPEAFSLYELIFKDLSHIVITSPEAQAKAIELPASHIETIGFNTENALLPTPQHGFDGYRLLLEFLHCPQKFLFFKFTQFRQNLPSFCHEKIQIHFLFKDRNSALEKSLPNDALAPYCTPIINLFKQAAEPIQFEGSTQPYHLIPDAQALPPEVEIIDIDHINVSHDTMAQYTQCEPFLGGQYQTNADGQTLYWQTDYKPCAEMGHYQLPGFECFVRIITPNKAQPLPKQVVLTPYVLCTNRSLTNQLPHGKHRATFRFKNTQQPLVDTIHLCTDISTPKYWPNDPNHKLHLLSHLNLNQLNLQDNDKALTDLKSALSLYQFGEHQLSAKLIESIIHLRATPKTIRHPDTLKQSFCQGYVVDITLNENALHANEALLFGQVLHAFLSYSSTVNSFIMLKVISEQRGELITLAPRLGTKAIA